MPCSRAANAFTVATACTGGPCAIVGVEEKMNHIYMTNKTNYAPYIPQTMMHGSFVTSFASTDPGVRFSKSFVKPKFYPRYFSDFKFEGDRRYSCRVHDYCGATRWLQGNMV
ncbi:unknown protein [Oryza sativa Japonica Group]|uniref:Uncharacterized protein n=1 Tax=Oryza sativa subsp. japonica TaxID=39947 RepID=Q5ZBB5_ORYSJ|nr:unknown protein [Oryza sativa Japonica Group]